ncbi:MAG: S8 family serine peptidase [Nitriliruptorales bacterium]|nr:S8 family serine peptidase [Nitriliruptorales bacterium]
MAGLSLLKRGHTVHCLPCPERSWIMNLVRSRPGPVTVVASLVAFLVTALALGPAMAAGIASPAVPEAAPGSLLVTAEPGAADAVQRAAEAGDANGLASAEVAPLNDQVLRVEVPPGEEMATAEALLERHDVAAVEPDAKMTLTAVPDDPLYPEQWTHELTGIEHAWDVTTGERSVKLAVIDSGIVADHPDLAGAVGEQIVIDPVTRQAVPGSSDNDICRVGHGTWVAGVAGAAGNNGMDVAGVAWDVELLDINVFPFCEEDGEPDDDPDSTLATFVSMVTAAIDYATASGAQVINLSLGAQSQSCPLALQTSISKARATGVTVVAASGNAGPDTFGFPDACNGAISVAGVGPTGAVASYASTSPFVDLTAPSGDLSPDRDPDDDAPLRNDEGVLTASWWDFGERTDSVTPRLGTSFSSPYMAGVAALLLSVNPDLSPDEVEGALESSAVDLGTPGRNPEYGWGLVDPTAAVRLVASGQPLPIPEPDPEFPVGMPLGCSREATDEGCAAAAP